MNSRNKQCTTDCINKQQTPKKISTIHTTEDIYGWLLIVKIKELL